MDGEDIHAAEFEDEKHFDGPAADAFDGGETFDELFVGEIENFVVSGDGASERARGEVFDIGNFGAREADSAEDEIFDGEHLFGSWMRDVWEEIVKAAHDGFGGASTQLLMGDGAQERVERRAGFVGDEEDGAGGFDDAAEVGIDFGKVSGGFGGGFGERGLRHFNSARRRGGRRLGRRGLRRDGWWARFFRTGLWRRFQG